MATSTVCPQNGGSLNVRAAKSTGSTKLGTISYGSTVNIVKCDSTWATLVYNNTPAFVMHPYSSPVPSANGDGLAAGDNAVCNAINVNIRSTANGSTTGSQLN